MTLTNKHLRFVGIQWYGRVRIAKDHPWDPTISALVEAHRSSSVRLLDTIPAMGSRDAIFFSLYYLTV